MTIILGIDPGAKRLGWAFMRSTGGFQFELIDSGTEGLDKAENETYNAFRWNLMKHWTESFPKFISFGYSECVPGEDFRIVSELLPATGSGNFAVATQSQLGQTVVTTCQTIALQSGVDWTEIAANSIKKMVTRDGRATKVRITNAVIDIFPHLKEREKELKNTAKDESDAIAVCLAGFGYKAPKK